MSDTPISDSTAHNVAELGMLCRRLERQLNAANERIKRLEEVGNEMAAWLLDPRNLGGGSSMASQWHKAKEDK
jgi:hypothetical protein